MWLFGKRLKSKLPKSVQQALPFEDMSRDGICIVADKDFYTKTIQFTDINYELTNVEHQESIFRMYCDFLNTFDSDVSIQFTFQNKVIDKEQFKKAIALPDKKYSELIQLIRDEYERSIFDNFEKGNNGIINTKYLTFGIHEKSIKRARIKLERVEREILRRFKKMKVMANVLNGYERLKLLKESLNPLETVPFDFDWRVRNRGVSVKDSITPSSVDFTKLDTFRIGRTLGRSYSIHIDNAEISDRIVEEIMSTNDNLTVNIHTQSMNQSDALKLASKKMTTIKGVKVGLQQQAAQRGHDGDILSMNLVSEIDSCESIYNAISRRNQRIFTTTLIVTVYGRSMRELAAIENDVKAITQKYNCELNPIDDQQREAAVSSLPIGINKAKEINRLFITTELATFMPFTSLRVFTPQTLYCGVNPRTGEIIMKDRKALINLGGLILGVAGSGKSFRVKLMIIEFFFRTNDRIIICDPEGEYGSLVKKLGGDVVEISATSKNYINPFDINLDVKGEDPIALKSQFILSMCEAAICTGHVIGLKPEEKSIIDRCVRKIYEPYIKEPKPENVPIFEDLYYELRKMHGSNHAQNIANALEIYVTGSLNSFNHRTNVNIDNRLVCFDIKNLSKHLHKMGLLIVMEHVWNKVSEGRNDNTYTHFYIDEFHILLKDELTADYCVDMWKRFRKWNALPTGITQNVTDLLSSPQIENIMKNSAFITLLSQSAGDREILSEKLNISPLEQEYITDTGCGEGLIYYNDKHSGSSIIPFKCDFPKDTYLYKLMSTSNGE